MSTFNHKSVAEVMGSWPISATGVTGPSGGTFSLLHKTLLTQARILGARREPAAGFVIEAKDFKLTVDGTPHVIAIDSVGISMDDVVSNINTTVGSTVAFNSDGFLLLKSTTIGEGSSLLLEVNTTGEDALAELGLFAGISSSAGELQSSEHVDPKRQIAYPGQLALLYGESFDVNSFNRLAFQMAVNSDAVRNFVDLMSIALPENFDTASYSPGSEPGVELTGQDVYVGQSSAPTTLALEKLFAVQDANGNELVLDVETVSGTSTGYNVTVAYEEDKQYQWVTLTGTSIFLATDVENNYYVRLTGMTGGNAAANGILFKIQEWASGSSVRISPVNPADGTEFNLNEGPSASIVAERVLIARTKVNVVAVKDSDGGSRIENVPYTKVASTAIDRLERNDRIYVEGADFVTNSVGRGDRVQISSSGVSSPYSNDGWYRVSNVIDEDTIEVVGDDWEPVFLNSIIGTGYGDITVESDGSFYPSPWVEFNTHVGTGDFVRVVHLANTTMRDASADPTFLIGGQGVQFAQEAEAETQAAIRRLAGPSTTSISDILHDQYWRSLEDIYFKYGQEHHLETGRHSSIQPDDATIGAPDGDGFVVIDNSGQTVIKRFSDANDVRIEAYTDTDGMVDGPSVSLKTSQGESLDALLTTADDQRLGAVSAYGVNSSNAWREAAAWRVYQDGTAGVGVPGRIEGWVSESTDTNPTLHFIMDSVGAVILGRASDLKYGLFDDLTVYGDSEASIRIATDLTSGKGTLGLGGELGNPHWIMEGQPGVSATLDLRYDPDGLDQSILKLYGSGSYRADMFGGDVTLLGDANFRIGARISVQETVGDTYPDGIRLIGTGAVSLGDNIAGIRAYSNDASFTTENPKLLGHAGFIAVEPFDADTDGGAAFEIWANPLNVGATADPKRALQVSESSFKVYSGGNANLQTTDTSFRFDGGGLTSPSIYFSTDGSSGGVRTLRMASTNPLLGTEWDRVYLRVGEVDATAGKKVDARLQGDYPTLQIDRTSNANGRWGSIQLLTDSVEKGYFGFRQTASIDAIDIKGTGNSTRPLLIEGNVIGTPNSDNDNTAEGIVHINTLDDDAEVPLLGYNLFVVGSGSDARMRLDSTSMLHLLHDGVNAASVPSLALGRAGSDGATTPTIPNKTCALYFYWVSATNWQLRAVAKDGAGVTQTIVLADFTDLDDGP